MKALRQGWLGWRHLLPNLTARQPNQSDLQAERDREDVTARQSREMRASALECNLSALDEDATGWHRTYWLPSSSADAITARCTQQAIHGHSAGVFALMATLATDDERRAFPSDHQGCPESLWRDV